MINEREESSNRFIKLREKIKVNGEVKCSHEAEIFLSNKPTTTTSAAENKHKSTMAKNRIELCWESESSNKF